MTIVKKFSRSKNCITRAIRPLILPLIHYFYITSITFYFSFYYSLKNILIYNQCCKPPLFLQMYPNINLQAKNNCRFVIFDCESYIMMLNLNYNRNKSINIKFLLCNFENNQGNASFFECINLFLFFSKQLVVKIS